MVLEDMANKAMSLLRPLEGKLLWTISSGLYISKKVQQVNFPTLDLVADLLEDAVLHGVVDGLLGAAPMPAAANKVRWCWRAWPTRPCPSCPPPFGAGPDKGW